MLKLNLPVLPPSVRPLIDHWCRRCGTKFESPHPRHFYCEPCSESQDLKRKRLEIVRANSNRRRDKGRDIGKGVSAENAAAIADVHAPPEFLWYVRLRFPFSWSASKNAIYALRRKGHVALRREAREYRKTISDNFWLALRNHRIVQNKLWVDIFVEKSSHRGDAANVVDTVCDAIKVATGLDDRWFCIRRLDWSVNKDNPQIFIGIGQEDVGDSQICSYCGRLLEFGMFNKNRATKAGITRICKDCRCRASK